MGVISRTIMLDEMVSDSVTDMQYMFNGCEKLTLDCSHFNVTNVTDYTNFNNGAPGVIAPKWKV